MKQITLGFIPEPIVLTFDKLLPSKSIPDNLKSSKKYMQILESLRVIGLIEPLTISPSTGNDTYVLLDGHTRLRAMQELGLSEAHCLMATVDETYTYNNRINRLSTIQEAMMIKRAIARGVPAEKIAKGLNMDLSQVLRKKRLLDGVCPEAAELLKDQVFSVKVGETLRKMKPVRQVECVELMVSSNTFSFTYAEALLAATPLDLLVDDRKPKKIRGVGAEQMLRMEREMSNLQQQYKLVEESYGQNVLDLVLAKGYLARLLENSDVAGYIEKNQPDVYSEFVNIVESGSLEK